MATATSRSLLSCTLRFLHRMQQYGLLEITVSTAFDRLEAGERADPTTTRASKIAMFKM